MVRCLISVLCVVAMAACETTTTSTGSTAALSVSLSSASVTGTTSVTGTVTTNTAAPTGGTTITLTSNSTAATVPATVTIPAGSTSTTFSIATTATNATATITATDGTTTATATLAVSVATGAISSLTFAANPTTGGVPVNATVTLSAAAPAGGASIALYSSSSLAWVPATVTIPTGGTSATFAVGTSPAATSASVTISASYQGVAQTATLLIKTIALSLGGTTSVAGGSSVAASVTLPAPAPDGGAVISLASDVANVIVPSAVTVSAGLTATTFAVTTLNVPPADTATISATYAGTTQTATLTVLISPVLSALQCVPSTVSGGVTVNCQGSLSPISPTGWTLVLGSDSNAASVPPTVTVSPGSSSVQFAIATTAVSTQTVATVQLFYASSVVGQLSLTINP